MGAPIRRTRKDRPGGAGKAALVRGTGDSPARQHDRELRERVLLLLHAERTGRGRGGNHSVERPSRLRDLEDRTRTGHGLHRRAEAGGGGVDLTTAFCRKKSFSQVMTDLYTYGAICLVCSFYAS